MEIKPQDIDQIKIVGQLNDDDVKMITTTGGYHIFVGKKTKYAAKPEAIVGVSHPAIGMHILEKQFKNNFEPLMTKSELDSTPKIIVTENTMPESLSKQGLGLYTLSKSNDIDFVVTKYGLTIGECKGEIINNKLLIKSLDFAKNLTPDMELAKTITTAIAKKAKEFNK